jgi:hypothetical protein
VTVARTGRSLLLASLLLVASPSLAATIDGSTAIALRGLAEEDARVARIGYALTTANVALCRVPANTAGFTVQALDQYEPPFRSVARATFDLDEHVAVLAVAPRSPAERAGLLVGDRLIAVDGQALPVATTSPPHGSYATVEAALDEIQQAFNRGDATLDILRGGSRRSLVVHPEAGCAVRTQLVTSPRLIAFADDRYASISTAMTRFAADDSELAFVIGHELAHGFLRHQALLSRHRDAPRRLVLETERQADYVALYMMARAGFDITHVPDFLRRFGHAQGMVLLFAKDHPSSRERVAAAEATIVEIRRKQAGGEPLTPSADFFAAGATAR